MKNVLFIASTGEKGNRLDGETIKSRLLRDFIAETEGIEVTAIDTDGWKKKIPSLVTRIIKAYKRCDVIVVSCSDIGAHMVIDFFYRIGTKKPIYYFVIGGRLAKRIKEKRWNRHAYKNMKHIYVEAEQLQSDLKQIEVENVSVLNNFRKVKTYKNRYKKTPYTKFVYFGRVIKEKGVEEAAKMVKRLNAEGIVCKFDIYGQCKKEYLPVIKALEDENISFKGEIKPDNKTEYEILSQYDMFLFPTEYPGECLPGALIDCYIAGLGVIASDWKYAKEYIEDGVNGRIFAYGNYEDMYIKTKETIKKGRINEYKEKSKLMSKRYLMETLLEDFRKELKNNEGL